MANVKLISYTPNPTQIVAAAAKLCYSPATVDKLLEGLTPEKSEEFVAMLAELGHESPTEHVSFTFAIEGVSRSLLAQITRHRIASFSVQSQRYVAENAFSFVTPPEILEDEAGDTAYQQAMEQCQTAYENLAEILAEKHKKRLLAEGMEEKAAIRTAKKAGLEDARFVLPNACTTKMIVTMNARSLQNFFRHRCCNRAQWELREVATEMLRQVKAVAPALFLQAGPSCMKGHCPEGKMSCKQMAQMREKYQNL